MIKPIEVEYKGKTVLMKDIIADESANVHGFKFNSVKHRMRRYGMDFETALETPRFKNAPRCKDPEQRLVSISMKGVHPDIRKEMLYGNSNSFLRACERCGR